MGNIFWCGDFFGWEVAAQVKRVVFPRGAAFGGHGVVSYFCGTCKAGLGPEPGRRSGKKTAASTSVANSYQPGFFYWFFPGRRCHSPLDINPKELYACARSLKTPVIMATGTKAHNGVAAAWDEKEDNSFL